MRSATDLSVAQELETDMKKKALVIGGIAVTAALVGGWALAQTVGHGPGGFGPPFMHGQGADGMGPGMIGAGMGHGMMNGNGMMKGMGPGMMHGAPGRGFADAEHIDELKAELGITPAQEPAWSKYAKAVQDAAAAMKTTREGVDPQAVSKMSPADRFAFVSKMREQAAKAIRRRQDGCRTSCWPRSTTRRKPRPPTFCRVWPRSAPARCAAPAWAARSTGIEVGGLAPPSSPLGAPAARGRSMSRLRQSIAPKGPHMSIKTSLTRRQALHVVGFGRSRLGGRRIAAMGARCSIERVQPCRSRN